MNPLEKIAVRFARECLGWDDAKAICADPEAPNPQFVVLSRSAQSNTLFAVSDPVDVQATVRRWCEGVGLIFTLLQEPGKRSATATLTMSDETQPLAVITAQHPCEALLSACLKAQEQLSKAPALAR